MKPEELKKRNLENEFIISTSRSSGSGGQNINKLNTRVELRFNIRITELLSDEEKKLIFTKLQNKINRDGELLLTAQSERTQLMNKKKVTEKFYNLLSKALTLPRKRKATRPTITSVKKRIEKKRLQGYKKSLRRQADDSSEG
jgi:ribosome-associated protein